jgi:ferritin-like metal-binding protein YciE
MQTQTNIISKDNTDSFKNDELQFSPQMILFEAEFKRTKKQISHLEKVFKSHLTVISNLTSENENK